MRKTINDVSIQGWLYEHNLEEKITGPTSKNPGTPFISGTVSVATDNACLNVIPVHFTYVTELTSRGRTNNTYTVLKNILDGKLGSIMEHGKDKASMVRLDSSLDLNEFYGRDGNFVSVKRNEGGFAHTATELPMSEDQRCQFTVDMVITGCPRIEADEEKNIPERMILKGAIFSSFRQELLPVEFTVLAQDAMNYFESLEPSTNNPIITKVWGREISKTVTRTVTEESAFGTPMVKEVKSSRKDFEIIGASPDIYDWDSSAPLTLEELKEASQQREIHKAEIKKRQDDYQASRAKASAFAAAATKNTSSFGDYNF